METSFFLKGMLLEFAIAAPLGSIGILCIRRTLQNGRLSGLFSGLGIALADTLYAIIAAFSLTFITDFLLAGQFWLRLIGGTFLLCLGLKMFLAKPTEKIQVPSHKSLFNDFISIFLLTISNPLTILAFLAIFASFGLTSVQESYSDASALVSGIFIGSAIWWIIVSEGVMLFRKKVSPKLMLWINRIAGLIIAAFGIWVLLTL